MVGERFEGGVGQRVDRVRTDQFVDVERVGVCVILGRCRRPQRPLHPGTPSGERIPTRTRERFEEQLIGEFALRDRSLAAQRECLVGTDRIEALVDLGVDAADEEARHAGDLREVGVGVHGQPFEPAEIGLDHLRVAVEAENQRDVDAASLGDHLLDRRQTFLGARDLDHQVAPVDPLVEVTRCGLAAGAVVGEAGRDLDADVAVDAVRVVVHLREHVAGAVDVVDHHRPEHVVDRRASGTEFGELLVVVAGVLDRLLEDRRVRGQPAHPTVTDRDESARGDVVTLEVVEPGALALFVVEGDDPVLWHACLS